MLLLILARPHGALKSGFAATLNGTRCRNCISNIHAAGMSHTAASDLLVWLLREAKRRQLSGINLKVDPAAALPPPTS
ncbi:hypothetical protein FNB15_14695 [Ferrovibrio terrae]|uniref:Uncharacterized protein n=1 Tax=Ferrovibrio terrae TaxID=2594003 RepID=A0A516H3U8_9PROT|nr:ethanolamine ammonia-lyase light chain EutC [Ferrovibrio terrae]QDO98447.1 hypothetical protein FNB15_14695 [Ferrovibrio terrae]